MIEIIVAIAVLAFAIDIYIGLLRRSRGMEFRFSRYCMYNLKPGGFSVVLSKHYYNLPDNEDVRCTFGVSSDGHLDAIRRCDDVLIGGSAAFGMGSPSNSGNITGHLRERYKLDVLNLAVPGWNIEQEVIALLRHVTTIRPKRVVFFDGANNLALALPFDYHGYRTSSNALAFYGESKYEEAVNQHFDGVPDIRRRAGALAREVLRHSGIARAVYRMVGAQEMSKASTATTDGGDFDSLASIAVNNYLAWLQVFVDVASSRGIEVHCVLQPYYAYGRDMAEVRNFNFYRINKTFDDYMISAYNQLDSALSEFKGITYHRLFREMASGSVGLFTDAVHLNEAGYGMIADKMSGIFLGMRQHDKETR